MSFRVQKDRRIPLFLALNSIIIRRSSNYDKGVLMALSISKLVVSAIALVFIAGCATTPGVIQKSDDVYTVNVSRGSASKVRMRAYQHARRHCRSLDRPTVQVLSENLRTDPYNYSDPSRSRRAYSIIDLDFICAR